MRARHFSILVLFCISLTVWGQNQRCTVSSFEGQVSYGQTYRHAINSNLELVLDPLPSGWLLRVLPIGKPRPQHDYAELATPPYQSVTPLAVSTDFSFRAQDAIAWNPRNFRFVAESDAFNRLMMAYNNYIGAQDSVSRRSAEGRLTSLVQQAQSGELRILDAKIVAGTADQAGLAAMVASHLSETAHSVVATHGETISPLGRITWFRFRISLRLPEKSIGNTVFCR